MMLKNDDTFRVECSASLSEDSIVSLLDLYQPLIGGDGVLLYLTLHAEARHQRVQSTHRHLSRIMGIDLDVLERARGRLEQYNLLASFCRSLEHHDNYIYKLRPPLPTVDFLKMKTYMSEFTNKIGSKDCTEIIQRLGNVGLSVEGYRNVTKQYINSLAPENVDHPVYQKFKPMFNYGSSNVNINFDYERFLSKASKLVFPVHLRTEENMELIGELATIYGISPESMVKIVKNCCTIDGTEMNTGKLRWLCKNTKPDVADVADPYDLPPASFLQSKQQGRPLTNSDMSTISYLAEKLKFPIPVVNVMIESILKDTKNVLDRKYVEAVASMWQKDGISTKEEAMREAKKSPAYAAPRRASGHIYELPEYMKHEAEPLEKSSEEDIAEVERKRAELKKRMAETKQQNH